MNGEQMLFLDGVCQRHHGRQPGAFVVAKEMKHSQSIHLGLPQVQQHYLEKWLANLRLKSLVKFSGLDIFCCDRQN